MPLTPYLDTFPKLGEACYIHDSAQVIGDVQIGCDSSVWCNTVLRGHSVILHGCTVGDECLIGMGSIVMDDAVIEKQVMLGAGSLVSPGKTLESGYLYVGRPAVRVRALNAEEGEVSEAFQMAVLKKLPICAIRRNITSASKTTIWQRPSLPQTNRTP